MSTGTLQVTTPSDREILMTRVFDAPRRLVWDAHTKPELLKRWLGVHNGWILAVCDLDLRVGGRYRFVWRNPKGTEMGMGGAYREILAPERMVATEKFDESWYPGEALDTTVMTEREGRTTVTVTVRYESKEARDGVLKSPMKEGMEIGYNTLAELLASIAKQGA